MSGIGTKRTFVFVLRMSAFGDKADITSARLTHVDVQENILPCWFPEFTSGTKEGTRTRRIRVFEFEAIRGCPRNCERRALGPLQPLGNWEGWTTKATTREPGDLPARSPNRWTGRPYGAVFRSGDGNAGAKAVRAKTPTTFRT